MTALQKDKSNPDVHAEHWPNFQLTVGLRDFSNNNSFEKKVNNISWYNPYKHIGVKIIFFWKYQISARVRNSV